MRKLVKFGIMIAIAAAAQIGANKAANLQRGYDAVGSEIFVFPIVCALEYTAYSYLSELSYEDEEEEEYDG